MKIPALMTPKNAVTASNIVLILDPALAANAVRARTVKRIHQVIGVSKVNDDFLQQTDQMRRKKPELPVKGFVHHGNALPISAAFALRYVHDLMRKWAA